MQRVRSFASRRVAPLATGLALALTGFAAAPALADDDRAATAEEVQRVKATLEGKGYTYVRDIEVDDGRIELEAVNPAGEPVDVALDLGTFEIVEEKLD
jgi:hypothetical protein